MPLKAYEENLERLDVMIRELKVKYDQFFAGGVDRQPFELRTRVDGLIDLLNRQPPGQLAIRFRFNSIISRYNSFCERWSKIVRTMEEGNHRHKSVAERFGIKERLVTRCLVKDTGQDRDELRRLHSRFVESRERHGKRGIPFEKFARGIASQAEQLRAKHECSQIEVRIVESGDGVQIKARPTG